MKHDSFFLTFACLIIAGALSSCSSTDSDSYVEGDSSWGGAAVGTAAGGFAGDYHYGTMNSLYYGDRYGYYGYTSPYVNRSNAYRAAAYGRAYRAGGYGRGYGAGGGYGSGRGAARARGR